MFEIYQNEYDTAELELLDSKAVCPENALEISIAKWEAVVAFYEEYPDGLLECGGRFTCALCLVHLYKKERCKGCPVEAATGEDCCAYTPYDDYVSAIDNDAPDEAYEMAKRELAFLQSLRPQ